MVHRAMEEGRLRRAPVLLIDRRVDSWVRRYPDVHVQTVAARQGRTRRDENHGDSIQLAVVGSADAEHVARLVWPDYHPVLGDANRSVLLVRPSLIETSPEAVTTAATTRATRRHIRSQTLIRDRMKDSAKPGEPVESPVRSSLGRESSPATS